VCDTSGAAAAFRLPPALRCLQSKKVQELVVAIIRQFTEAYGPLILVLEDLHHFDSASWRLLSNAIGDGGLRDSVLFIMTYR
jgi:predicted ATPase